MRYVLDYIIPVVPLNNTFSTFTLDLIYRFVLPTYSQLSALYSSLGRIDSHDNELDGDDDGEHQRSFMSNGGLEFFEEQRANRERRMVYEHAEDLFERYNYIPIKNTG